MTYYKKLLLTSVLICITFSLILCTTIFSLYYLNMYSISSINAKKFVEKTTDNFDEMLLNVKNYDTILKYSNDITEFVQNPNPIPHTVIKSRNYINNTIFSLEDKCYMTALSKINDNFVLSSFTMDLDYYCTITGINKEAILSFYNSCTSGKGSTSEFITSYIDKKQALTFLKYQKYENNTGCILMSTYLLEKLIDMPDTQYGTVVLYINNIPVVSYGKLDYDDACKFAETGSKDYTPYTVYGKNNYVAGDMKCVFLLNNSMLSRPIFDDIILISVACLLFLLISIFVMYKVTKRNYLPVKSTIDTLKEFGEINSESEFEFISNTFQNLYEENNSLTDILKSNSISLEIKFFKELALGMLPEKDISEFFSTYPKLFTEGKYLFALVSYNKYFELEKHYSPEALFCIKRNAIKNLEGFFSDSEFVLVFDIDHMSHGIILQVQGDYVVENKLKSFIIQFESNYSIELYATIGNAVRSIKDLHKSYTSAKRLYDNVMFAPSQNLIYTESSFNRDNSKTFIYPVNLESSLIESIVQCNQQLAFSIIDNIFDTCTSQCEFTHDILSQFIFMLAATFNRTLATINKSASEIFEDSINIFLELKMQQTIEELNKKLKEFYTEVINAEKETIILEGTRSAEFMLSFIYENYMNDIALVDLSEKLNMSQNYAGRLFKKLTNTNFKEYLMWYRFTKAKEILCKHKNIKIKDVAPLVGCNSEILTRIFLKYTGKTPSEFREAL